MVGILAIPKHALAVGDLEMAVNFVYNGSYLTDCLKKVKNFGNFEI